MAYCCTQCNRCKQTRRACSVPHWGINCIMQTVAETPTFTRQADKLLGDDMSTFGDDLIQALNEALAHAKGDGFGIVHAPMAPREVRKQAKLTQAQMAPLMGMSLSGYPKWEQGTRRVSGPAATLLRVIEREPEAVKRALSAPG